MDNIYKVAIDIMNNYPIRKMQPIRLIKICILNSNKSIILNKRSELLAKNKCYACNIKPP